MVLIALTTIRSAAERTIGNRANALSSWVILFDTFKEVIENNQATDTRILGYK
jgi:hypothetical protein|tara:strand:+ start:139 stop:297 length:159 start_codon:yes stop_codon:yes gene_type:complete